MLVMKHKGSGPAVGAVIKHALASDTRDER